MIAIPATIEAIALASAALSIICLAVAAIHAVRFEQHQRVNHQEGDRQ